MYQVTSDDNSQSAGKNETSKIDLNANPELFNAGEPFKAISEITENTVDNVETSIVLIDAGMRDVINKMGQGENLSDGIRKNLADAAPLVTRLGGDVKAALQVQLDTLDTFGRNITLTDKQIEELYAVNKVTGVGVKELETGFADAGMAIEHISEEMLTVRETANSLGVNAKAVSASVVGNLDKMNRYTFDGGIQGLAKMASRAQALRIDMKTTFDLADQLMSPEKAIEVSSALQRLGATTTSLVDPLKLMDMAQNDVGALQQELGEMFKTYTAFDEKTGKFEIMPGARRQLKEIGDSLGIPIKEIERMALGSADLDKKLSEISFGGLDLTDEQQEMIANMSTMGEGGEYKIRIKDEEGKLVEKKLSEVLEDYKGREGELTELLSEQQAEEGKTAEEKMLKIAEQQLDELTKMRSSQRATAMIPSMKVAGSPAAREVLEFNVQTTKIVNDQVKRLFDNDTINNAIESFGGNVGKLNDRIKDIYETYEKSGFKDTETLKADLSKAVTDATNFGKDFGEKFMTGIKEIVKEGASFTPFFNDTNSEEPPSVPKDEEEKLPFKKIPKDDEKEDVESLKPPKDYTDEEIQKLSTKLNPLKIQTTKVEIDGIALKDMMSDNTQSDNQKTIKIDDGIIDVKNSQAIPLDEGTIVKYNPKDNIYQTEGNLIATTNNLSETTNTDNQTINNNNTTNPIIAKALGIDKKYFEKILTESNETKQIIQTTNQNQPLSELLNFENNIGDIKSSRQFADQKGKTDSLNKVSELNVNTIENESSLLTKLSQEQVFNLTELVNLNKSIISQSNTKNIENKKNDTSLTNQVSEFNVKTIENESSVITKINEGRLNESVKLNELNENIQKFLTQKTNENTKNTISIEPMEVNYTIKIEGDSNINYSDLKEQVLKMVKTSNPLQQAISQVEPKFGLNYSAEKQITYPPEA